MLTTVDVQKMGGATMAMIAIVYKAHSMLEYRDRMSSWADDVL